jgi:hypothetical protein
MEENYNAVIDGDESGSSRMKNSIAVLVLGILSLVTCFCYGIFGVILGIIALAISRAEWTTHKANPGQFQNGDVSNMRAGRICCTIGICLGGLYLLIIVVAVLADLAF